MGIMPVVRQVELGELLKADEAFLTNSILEIMPLTRLDDKPIGSGTPGPVTQQLMSTYKELIAKEV
jgi:branched-subunit amino acid aminotransferase/4-amino-4-deoxychorismate lyase